MRSAATVGFAARVTTCGEFCQAMRSLEVHDLHPCPDVISGFKFLGVPDFLFNRQQVGPGLAVREDGCPP